MSRIDPSVQARVHARLHRIRGVLVPLVFAVLFSSTTTAQTDSTALDKDFLWRARHSRVRAAIFSTVLPGAGQVYNRKYWKVPIVLGGLGVSYWFIQRNTTEYERYKDAYLAVIDNDPNTVDEFNGEYTAASLLNVTDTYRRWRDLSYIAFGAVYILNIVDASIDAHFVRFDVGRDLGLSAGPSPALMAIGVPAGSVRLAW